MKNIFRNMICLFLSLAMFLMFGIVSCSKVEEEGKKKMEESRKKSDNAFSEYVETGTNTLTQSKDLNKRLKEQQKKMDKEMLE